MAYSKQAWRDYDDTKTENQNRDRGAVVTPERLNHMETGIANSADKQEVTSQLDHIENSKLDKNGVAQIDMVNFNQETKEYLANVAQHGFPIVEENTVTRDHIVEKEIIPELTSFLELSGIKNNRGNNLFNVADISEGVAVNVNHGQLIDAPNFFTSEHIEVTPESYYEYTRSGRHAEYDADGNFIKGRLSAMEFKTDKKTRTIRVSDNMSNLEGFKLNRYTPVFKMSESIVGNSGIEDKLIPFNQSENMLNVKKPYLKGRTISNAINFKSPLENPSYDLYIVPVKPSTTYTISNGRQYWGGFINRTHAFVKVFTTGLDEVVTFTTDSNVYYVFLNVYKDFKDEFMMVEGSSLPEEYIPYEIEIPGLKIEQKIDETTNDSPWKNKKVVNFGDSITWYDNKTFGSIHKDEGQLAKGYQGYLRDELGMNTVNVGSSGNNLTQILNTIKNYDYSGVDAVTITSGANDWSQQRAIGEIALPKSTFDENTYYGALQSAVEHISNVNRSIKIILITPIRGYHPATTHSGIWLDKGIAVNNMLEQPDDYAQAVWDVAKLYGLEVIDFRDGTGLNFLNYEEYLRDIPESTSGKYVHPGNEFFEIMGKYAVERFKNISI